MMSKVGIYLLLYCEFGLSTGNYRASFDIY